MTYYVAMDYDGVIFAMFDRREDARAYSRGPEGQANGALRVGAWPSQSVDATAAVFLAQDMRDFETWQVDAWVPEFVRQAVRLPWRP